VEDNFLKFLINLIVPQKARKYKQI